MSRGPDAATQFERALLKSGESAGLEPVVRTAEWTRWASATFTGARHHIGIALPDAPALESWLTGLPDAEFALRGHLVADLIVTGRRDEGGRIEVEIEALTVEER